MEGLLELYSMQGCCYGMHFGFFGCGGLASIASVVKWKSWHSRFIRVCGVSGFSGAGFLLCSHERVHQCIDKERTKETGWRNVCRCILACICRVLSGALVRAWGHCIVSFSDAVPPFTS